MKSRRAVCTGFVEVTVSWSYPGSRYYPSVYHFCEPCADVFCTWLESGSAFAGYVPDNIAVDDADGQLGLECRTQLEAAS